MYRCFGTSKRFKVVLWGHGDPNHYKYVCFNRTKRMCSHSCKVFKLSSLICFHACKTPSCIKWLPFWKLVFMLRSIINHFQHVQCHWVLLVSCTNFHVYMDRANNKVQNTTKHVQHAMIYFSSRRQSITFHAVHALAWVKLCRQHWFKLWL